LLNTAPLEPTPVGALVSERSFNLSETNDGEWAEGSAPLVEPPPSYAAFRPCALVLMALVGALSGGTMDVAQLSSALRSLTALCREASPPPRQGSAAGGASSKGNGSAAKGTGSKGSAKSGTGATGAGDAGAVVPHNELGGSDGNQPVLADTFAATAVRLGALVSLVLLPQTMPVVAGAWEVISEACDLALFLARRGQVREQFWGALPATASGGGQAACKPGSQPGSREGVTVAVGGKLGSSGGNSSSSSGGGVLSRSGVPDPNRGPTAAHWAPLLNVAAFVQPAATTRAHPETPAPPPGKQAALAGVEAGAYWPPLLAAVGASPTWSPKKIDLAINDDGTYPCGCGGGHIEVVVQAKVHAQPVAEGAAPTTYEVEVTLLQAFGLPNADMLDKSDPQVGWRPAG
jgi:hypothetical protein